MNPTPREKEIRKQWNLIPVRYPQLGNPDEDNLVEYRAGFLGLPFSPRVMPNNPLDETESEKAMRQFDHEQDQRFWYTTGSLDGPLYNSTKPTWLTPTRLNSIAIMILGLAILISNL